MNDIPRTPHLSAERMQAFLDGGLPRREERRVEEHLSSCARCAAEVEGWSALFHDLDDLPRLVPHEGFQERVLTAVEGPARLPLAARVGGFLKGLLPGGSHPPAEDLQDLLEGALPARAGARIQRHLDGCTSCTRELAAWRELLGELDGLERLEPSPEFAGEVMATWKLEQALDSLGYLEPSEGFAARVMAGVRIPEPATAPAAVPAPSSDGAWGRLLAAARRLVPETRRAWAALSGVAVAPAATLGLVLWTLVSHPTLTPSSLAAFTVWKAGELAGAAWTAMAAMATESFGAFALWEAVSSVGADPFTLASVGLAFAAGSLVSAWVLYRNLIATHTVDGRYAHAHS